MKLANSIYLLLIAVVFAAGPLQASLPMLPEIPPMLPDEVRETLIVKRAPLDKQCKLLQTETKLTIVALFNNATRRVAVHEVERLTTMTEDQLRGLTKISELMARHVLERNEVRTKLKELE